MTGPLPIAVSNDYKFIKVYDGSTTSVAVSGEYITIMPGMTVKPTSGAAGSTITITGGGFPSSTMIDVAYFYTMHEWTTGGAIAVPMKNLTTGINTAHGYWTITAAAPDTGQAVNAHLGPYNNVAVNLVARSEKTPHLTYAAAVYNEGPRFISQVLSLDNAGNCVDCATGAFHSTTFYGNDTGSGTGAAVINGITGTVANLAVIDAKVKGTLIIAGNNSYASGPVTFWIGATQIGSTTADTTGVFNGTATIPVLPSGNTVVLVNSNSVVYQFTIDVLPTLILTPAQGPVGTHVTVTAYGFPKNSHVSLWWFRYTTSGPSNDYYLINGTVDTTGSFNVTVTFTVPHSYGGDHSIDATTHAFPTPVLESTLTGTSGYVTSADFTVTATLTVSPTSVNANQKGFIVASGTGFNPDATYVVNIDHSGAGTIFIEGGANGDLAVNFTSTGFRPGWHQVELDCMIAFSSSCVVGDYNYSAPSAFAYFNVTTTGDYQTGGSSGGSVNSTQLTQIQNTLTLMESQLSYISDFNGTLSDIQTAIGNINVTDYTPAFAAISSKIDALSTSVNNGFSGIASTLTSITNSITSLTSIVQGINTAVGPSGNIGGSIASMQTSVNNTKSSVDSVTTYVLVVAVLAAITLVLELAIMVRKLS